MNEEKLSSERLTFRRWTENDVEKVLEIYQKPQVYRFLGNPPAPMKDIEGKIESLKKVNIEKNYFYQFYK